MSRTPVKFKVAKKKGDKTAPELHFDFGADLNASSGLFGAEAVHALFVSAARQQLTDWARKLYTRKKSPLALDIIQLALDNGDFTPGLKKRGKSSLEKAAAFLDAMSPEERTKLAEMAAKFAPAPAAKTETPS